MAKKKKGNYMEWYEAAESIMRGWEVRDKNKNRDIKIGTERERES